MKYLISLLFVFTALTCSDNPVAPETGSEFFPLNVGNWWRYTGTLDMIIRVEDKVKINNNFYYLLIKTYPESSDTMRLRYDNRERLMIWFDGQEYLYIDFSLPEGSRWNSYYNFYGQIRNKGLNSTVPAGIFSNVTEILFDNTLISDVYEFNRYAPGAGMISSSGFRRNFYLTQAQVNGNIYP